ncbi:DUF3293 domain-containing protein [Dyella flagellata]|uniref:DUF3293 domain-containing protein n=1 Tax=Dyella flagellata TaxID=1867833 RepID=A0ABQ5X5T0_9GAMM|nr:DUF3293 domain-containing protein [Dyella flagellata]GLQ86954.1 hypothetical protein GCM10007898_05200 [Dyella flagellata]
MDSALIAAYRGTDYRVRLTSGGFASIRVDAPVPAPLSSLIGPHSWAFITAWNPGSRARPRDQNHVAQQDLLAALRKLPSTLTIHPAVGVGEDWREPSFFVVGPGLAETDVLAQQFQQNAYIHGLADGYARLRLTSGEPPRGQAG